MAQLKDLIVNGATQLVGDATANQLKLTQLVAPASANSTTYGQGENGQVLHSTSSGIYWGDTVESVSVTADFTTGQKIATVNVDGSVVSIYAPEGTTQVNANWTATTGIASILNKPSIPSTYSDVGAASTGHTHTYSAVGAASAAHTHTAADVGAVPTSRTVNGKSLNANITLSAADVGALPTTTVIPAAQVNSDWNATTGVSSILNKPSIPAAQVNANWTATTGVASILNKPSIPSTYSDVGAASSGHTHTYSAVGAASAAHTHTYSDVGAASAVHVHGSITSDGKITATGVAIANGDGLVIVDSSDSSKIKKSSITFGTSTTSFLANNGTWMEPDASGVTIDDGLGLGSYVEEAILAIDDKTIPLILTIGDTSITCAQALAAIKAKKRVLATEDDTFSRMYYVSRYYESQNQQMIEFYTLYIGDDNCHYAGYAYYDQNNSWAYGDVDLSIFVTPSFGSGLKVADIYSNGDTESIYIPSIPSTYSDVGAASAAHVHGAITSDGTIAATNTVAIANGDALVITDSSDSSKIKRSSITFGTSTNEFLTRSGTWKWLDTGATKGVTIEVGEIGQQIATLEQENDVGTFIQAKNQDSSTHQRWAFPLTYSNSNNSNYNFMQFGGVTVEDGFVWRVYEYDERSDWWTSYSCTATATITSGSTNDQLPTALSVYNLVIGAMRSSY